MRKPLTWVPAVIFPFIAAGAWAAEPTVDEMMTTITALKMRLKDQSNRLSELESQVAQQNTSMAKLAKELAADADKQFAGPKWLDNLKFYGDLRLRYQNDCRHGAGRDRRPKMRNRARFRLRFGIKKTWLDEQLEVGFRLASGHEDGVDGHVNSEATSTNQTFRDNFAEKPIWIDRAYAKYTPKAIPGLTLVGGKMANPFVHTDLIWDSDVNPEGVWGQLKKAFGPIEPFVNAGYFILEDDGGGDHQYDRVLMAYQAGANTKIGDVAKWTFAATYYDYDHSDMIGRGEFQSINLLNKVGFKVMDVPVSVYFDYVHNCRNEETDEAGGGQDNGYAAGFKLGTNKKKGDWSVGYKWAYIEQNCTPGEFNDSDFGGTNTKGHLIKAKYNLTDFLTFGGGVFLLEGISGDADDDGSVVTQIDLVWKF